ncbi:MAG: hypothetical protein HYY02_08435 [Chloroflexi bacterium]|nr:hypothetical protein [Chloroflexota bacterium]
MQQEEEGLTLEERAAAVRRQVYAIWYQDRFSYFADREPASVVALCEREEQAKEIVGLRPLPASLGDGYEYDGPWDLLAIYDSGTVTVEQVRRFLLGERPNLRDFL